MDKNEQMRDALNDAYLAIDWMHGNHVVTDIGVNAQMKIAAALKLIASQPVSADAANNQSERDMQQVGWIDQFGNVFPMGAWKPQQRTYHDDHKTVWKPVFAARADQEKA